MPQKKNKKVMSLAIDPELHDSLKDYCERKDISASSFLGDLVQKSITISIEEEQVVVGVDPEALKKYCEKKDISISSLLRELGKKALAIPTDEEPAVVGKPTNGDKMIILKIPSELKGNEAGLKSWLADQTDRIVVALGK